MAADGGSQRIPEAVLDQARNAFKPSEVLQRYGVGLKRTGHEFRGYCPFHADKNNPSLTVNDAKHIIMCFSCGWHGNTISIVMQLGKLTFHEAVRDLLGGSIPEAPPDISFKKAAATGAIDDEKTRLQKAQAIWAQRQPIRDTVAWTYLTVHRKLSPNWFSRLQCYAFHPGLYFAPLERQLPALIAGLTNSSGTITAVQATFLDPQTSDKAEPRREAKRTRGLMRKSAVRLGTPRRILGIAEGNETGITIYGRFAIPVAVCCGAARMKDIWVPDDVDEIVIYRDAGETGDREARAAAAVHEDIGRRVMIEMPPDGCSDFNDAEKSGIAL